MVTYGKDFVGPIRHGDTISRFSEKTLKKMGEMGAVLQEKGTISNGKVTTTYVRGGGGGSVRAVPKQVGPTRADLEAEQKRQAELKRQQEEAKKLADQVQQAKQDKAKSQTIGGQVTSKTSGPQPLTVSAYNKEDAYTAPRYKQGIWESTKQSFSGLFSDIKEGNLGSPSKYVEPFRYSERIKKDVVAYVNPVFGTVQTDPLTGKVVTGDVTYGDIQKGIEERRDKKLSETSNVFETKATGITSGYQRRVDAGELTVEQATEQSQKEFDVLNVEYGKEQEKSYKKYKDVPGVFERTGTTRKVVEFIPDALAVSASLAVGAVNPVAGASIGVGYFTGKGVLQAAQKPTFKEIGEQGGIFAGTGFDDKGGISILEPTELDVKYKKLRREAGINLLVGATYGVGLVGAYSKSIITGELAELGESKIKVLSVSKQTGKGSTDIIKGIQTKGGLRREFTITGRVIKEGEKSYILPSGQGYSTTTGTFDWNLYKGYGKTGYAGGDIFKVGAKGTSIPIKDGFFSFGKGVIEPQVSFGSPITSLSTSNVLARTVKGGGKKQIDFFASVSKKIGTDKAGAEYYKSVSGKVNLEKYTSLIEGKGGLVEGGGFDVFGVNKASFNPNTFGIQKVIKVGASSVDDALVVGGESFFSFGRGATTRVVKGYGEQSLQSGVLSGVSKSVSAGQIKAIVTPSLSSSVTKAIGSLAPPSIVQMGGTGKSKYSGVGGQVYDNIVVNQDFVGGMKGYSILEQKPTNFIFQGSSIIPKVKSGTRGGFGVGTLPKQSSIISSALVPKQSLVPRQLTGQRIKQQTIQQQIFQAPVTQAPLLRQGLIGDFGFGLPSFPFILPKMAQFKKSKRRPQKGKQKTAFQTSFTGSILGIKGKGLAPGGLSIRGSI